jgi:hypothetical protein
MPRLGDLLIQAGRVSQTQVEDAARSQVAYGGRLGTNLVELGYLELDELAAFLGRQHRLPAAERGHFEQADAALQALLPAGLAGRHHVVPIARLAADASRIAVAALGPLSPAAVAELAAALDAEPADLVFAVAPELRILYNLEKVYDLRRPTRFLRSKRGGTQEIPITPEGDDAASDDELSIPVTVDAEVTPTRATGTGAGPTGSSSGGSGYAVAGAGEHADAVLEISPDAGLEPGDERDERERRRFVRTIADTDPPATHAIASGAASEPASEITNESQSLGRISLRKVALAAAVEGGQAPGETTAEQVRAIRRCRDRDRIGTLAVECLARQCDGAIDAAVLFIARGPIAVVWKGFARRSDIAFDQLAVPLDQPSIVARDPGPVVRRLAVATDAVTALDRKLVDALAVETPTWCVAAPIAIRDQLIGFAYAQGRGDQDTAEALLFDVADATRSALTSLLRAAQR